MSGDFLSTEQIIKFNDKNFVYFNDIGRKTSGTAVWYGNAITFKWHVNGEVKTLGPYDTTGTSTPSRLGSMIKSIIFKDNSHIWILSRLGNRLDGLVLLDLNTGSFDAQYRGQNFLVSPDSQKIAYIYPDYYLGDMLFINDAMVWPEQKSGFTKSGIVYPETKDGTQANKISLSSKNKNKIIVRNKSYKWKTNDSFQFSVGEPHFTDLKNKIDYSKPIKQYSRFDYLVEVKAPEVQDLGTSVSMQIQDANFRSDI